MARRGALENPPNRFERVRIEPDSGGRAPDEPDLSADPRTRYYDDPTRSVLARNQSPDVGFDVSINPYRGCAHGCIYCYARPTHEYLGFSAGLDFETRILVKRETPALLRRKLASARWRPQVIGLSGVTDCYQPVERRLRLTRGCLEVLAEFRNPVALVTKNRLVLRDRDLLEDLARHRCVQVQVSLTTLDPSLHRVMEPRASAPALRLDAMRRLSEAGVPVGVMVAPVIPGLNDHEIPALLEAAAGAGARSAAYLVVRLPHGVKELFAAWLERHYPQRKEKVLSRLRALRGGRLSDPRFGSRHRGEGLFADQIRDLFRLSARRHGLDRPPAPLATEAFRRPDEAPSPQLALF